MFFVEQRLYHYDMMYVFSDEFDFKTHQKHLNTLLQSPRRDNLSVHLSKYLIQTHQRSLKFITKWVKEPKLDLTRTEI